jgi:hypothetical protein
MIKNRQIVEKFSLEYYKKRKYSYRQALRIFTALWKEAHNFKILPFKNPLEDIEPCLKIAKVLNSKKYKK